MNAESEGQTSTEFWEAMYRNQDRVWSGRVNAVLAEEAQRLPAGSALDVGCGEGGDAVWLAERGWRVTAVDVSNIALERAGAQAQTVGVADRITWAQHDLARSFPDGQFDLVSSHYLHSPVEFPRERVLQRAADGVRPGGTLLVVGHAAFPPWAHAHEPTVHFPTPDEVVSELDLASGGWSILRCESVDRKATGPDGQLGTLIDSIVVARRVAGPS